MNTGEFSGRHYATRQPVRLRWADGVIVELATAPSSPPDVWIAPALFDLQVNGFAGVDFQQDTLTIEDLWRAVCGLRAAGCTKFLLTLVTDDWPRLMARLRALRALRAQSAELIASIAGWHIEGPFLSAEPGFHGAHDPGLMVDPTPEHLRELRRLTGDDPVLLTLAPERNGALAAIELAGSLGFRISLGHSDASADTLALAVATGATMFTHLGNGCPSELNRHDNILWRVFETPGLTSSLIPDGIHVSPALFRLQHRVLGPAICYTTDAVAAAGSPPGRYTVGKMTVEVGPDQIVRQPGRTNFAGAALRPVEGVFRAAAMLQCPWQEAWERFSEVPARLMGLRNQLAVGQSATFCRVTVGSDGRLLELQTEFNG